MGQTEETAVVEEVETTEKTEPVEEKEEVDVYSPVIDPADFSTTIDNKYMTFVPGMRWVYEGETDEGTETIEVYVTKEAKNVMGVDTVVVWDRVWLDGELTENTKDWYAQDDEGNVWYFGEMSEELSGGEVVSTEGSWEAGVDGALPGIIMLADPVVGKSYRQEYYLGKAEDMGEVLSLSEKLRPPLDKYEDCIKTRDWNPLENEEEHKFYCAEVKNVALEVDLEDGERVELVSFEQEAEPSKGPAVKKESAEEEPATKAVTESEAIAIARTRVNGTLKKTAIETKYGKKVYAIEFEEPSGVEKEVLVEIATGKVIAVEVQ